MTDFNIPSSSNNYGLWKYPEFKNTEISIQKRSTNLTSPPVFLAELIRLKVKIHNDKSPHEVLDPIQNFHIRVRADLVLCVQGVTFCPKIEKNGEFEDFPSAFNFYLYLEENGISIEEIKEAIRIVISEPFIEGRKPTL